MTRPRQSPWILLADGTICDRHHYVSTRAEDGTLPPPASPEMVAARRQLVETEDYLRELRADPARQKRLAEQHLAVSNELQAENEFLWAAYIADKEYRA